MDMEERVSSEFSDMIIASDKDMTSRILGIDLWLDYEKHRKDILDLVTATREKAYEDEYNPWRLAMIGELETCHALQDKHLHDPTEALRQCIASNVQMAMDPKVSEDAMLLVRQARIEGVVLGIDEFRHYLTPELMSNISAAKIVDNAVVVHAADYNESYKSLEKKLSDIEVELSKWKVLYKLTAEANDKLNALLNIEPITANPVLPKHQFWSAGEVDCPNHIKAANGELHTLLCKNCHITDPRSSICFRAQLL